MAPILVGREPEVAAVARFLDRARQNSCVMLVEGEMGAGKTSVLAAAREAGREHGWLVLAANPAEPEMPLEYTGIADLLDPLPTALTDELPGPQRRAIRVALLREEAPEPPVDLRTVATAAVTILRRAAASQPVLMIVDDLHWLDLSSARVLAFVLRRLHPAPVSLLASVRTGRTGGRPVLATDTIPPWRLDRLVLGSPSPGDGRGQATGGERARHLALNSGDLLASRQNAEEALEAIERGDGNAALEAQYCAGLALLDFMLCRPPRPGITQRALAGASCQPIRLSMELRPNVAIGHVLHWNGDLDGARRLYEEEYRRAREEGIERELPLLLWGLVETETWAGRWARAEQLAEQGCRAAEEAGSTAGSALMLAVRSLLHVCRGRVEDGRRDAERSMRAGAELGMPVVPRMGAHALGVAGLSYGDAASVHEQLGPLVQPAGWSQGLEPALWRFLPDEIEALVRLGQLDEAQAVLEPYEWWSAELRRGQGMAGAARCRGLLLAAHGDLAGAEAALENAISQCGTVRQPFETARTLLTAGEVHRRARHKRLAKMRIMDALALFESLGAPAWAARTRRELACVGLRAATPQPLSLTPAEQRVADLVVLGHSNARVASELFMGRRTVESHLSRIYQKLEVHSRTELCRLLSTSGLR